MFRLSILISVLCLFSISCGSASDAVDYPSDVPTKSPPIVMSVAPSTGAAGDTITIYGVGFSSVPAFNTIIIGGAAIAATAYDLVPAPTSTAVEFLTAAVPAGAAVGADSILVLVHESPSNADTSFTVTP